MRTVAALIFVALFAVAIAPLILAGIVFGIREPLYDLARWAMRTTGWILGIRIEVAGLDRFDPRASYVFMPNHLSLLDGPLAGVVIPQRVRVIIKKSISNIPILGWGLRHLGCVPVDRKGESGGKRSIEKAAGLMSERGYSFMVFPEGTRSRDGKTQKFRRGGFFLALQAGVPIVPVTIRGSFELMPKGQFQAKRGTIRIEFHPPVSVEGFTAEGMQDLADRVRDRVLSGL